MAARNKASERAGHLDAKLLESTTSLHLDGWMNIVTGIGVQDVDKRVAGRFGRGSPFGNGGISGTIFDRNVLDDLYHGDGLSGRIIDLPVREQFREWIEIGGDPDNVMGAALESLDVRGVFAEAKTWGKLHGDAVAIMGINDGQEADQPLNENGIKSFDWFTILDRWDLRIVESYDDPLAQKWGTPKLYEIVTTTPPIGNQVSAMIVGARIHESRVIRFSGARTSSRRRRDNQGFCLSVLERTYEIVRDFMSSYAGAAHLLQDFSQATLAIKNLQAMLASDKGDAKVIQRIRLLNYCRSVLRILPIDADGETFERKSTPVAGLPEMLDRLGTLLSATTDIPQTLLLGNAPSGMNATGEGDHRNWYNVVHAEQEQDIRPKLARVMKLLGLARSIKAQGDDGQFTFTFRPLWQPSQKEVAEVRKLTADTDNLYVAMGALDPSEVRTSRWGGDKYSIETVIDAEADVALSNVPDDVGDDGKPIDGAAIDKPADAADPSTAFNGAQVTALVDIVAKVAAGEIPRDSGVAIITVAFPVDAAGAEKVMGTAGKGFKPTEPAPMPMPFGGTPKEPAIEKPKQEVP